MSDNQERQLTYSEAIREALADEMSRDPKVVLIGEDIGVDGGAFKVTVGLLDQFGPKRVFDTPISEDAIIGVGLGAALTGLRPMVEIMFSTFIGCAMEEVWNQVSKIRYMSGGQMRVPLVIRTVNCVGIGAAAQHSGRPEAWFMHMPGLKVALPATPADAKGLLKTALRGNDPVLVFEHALLYAVKGPVPGGDGAIPFGQAVVRRPGSDVTIVSYSRMVHTCLEAAETLAADGIEAEVIDLRTLVPLDEEAILASVRKTNRAVIASDDCRRGGVGAEIAARIMEEAFDDLDAPVQRVAARDVPIPFSPVLEEAVIPNATDVVFAAKRSLGLS
jgi:acetoin:2,6-dichlorophenolindophenol oxidoreductase subunit beta